jgi:hypothetical protein
VPFTFWFGECSIFELHSQVMPFIWPSALAESFPGAPNQCCERVQ